MVYVTTHGNFLLKALFPSLSPTNNDKTSTSSCSIVSFLCIVNQVIFLLLIDLYSTSIRARRQLSVIKKLVKNNLLALEAKYQTIIPTTFILIECAYAHRRMHAHIHRERWHENATTSEFWCLRQLPHLKSFLVIYDKWFMRAMLKSNQAL